ncbi:hypothetical protein TWF281_010443 [Arthrobotrys megalospora]
MQGKIPHPSDDVRHVFFRVTVYQKLPLETSDQIPHRPLARSVQSATALATPSRPKRAAPCSGFSSHTKTKTKSLPSLGQSTVLSISPCSSRLLPTEPEQASEPVATMGEKDKGKRRRSSRRQSILSIASTYFGPMALGSDISLDRQISPALQTSHVFFGEDTFANSPSRSPYSLSQRHLPDDASPTSSAPVAPAIGQGPDLPCLASPTHPSPPAPSLVPSTQLSPAASGESSSFPFGSTTTGTATTATGTRTTTNTTTRQNSKLSSIGSFLPPFPESRRQSIAQFFQNARDLPSRMFGKSSSKSPSPPQLRSTCPITEKDTMPPKKRRFTKVEKAALNRQKSADKYIQKKTKKRLRQYRREMKRRMSQTEEAKEARKKMGKTEKLLKVMDDAKEKFWEWLDKREEKKRRKQTMAYTAMREERRKSVLLVPVERDYAVLSRRGSRYRESIAEGQSGRPVI